MEEGSRALYRVLFGGGFQFYLELFIPFHILLSHNHKRKYFWLFFALSIVLAFPFYYLPPLMTGSYNWYYFVILCVLYAFSFSMYRENPGTLACAGIIAFGLQHLEWNLLGLLFDIFNPSGTWPRAILILCYFVIYLFVDFLFWLFLSLQKVEYRWQSKDAWSLIFGTIIISVAVIVSQFIRPWNWGARLYSVLIMILGVALELVIPWVRRNATKAKSLEDDKKTLESLLQQQAEQMETSKKEQEILNLKFHDLKHQIQALKSMDGEERNKTLEEMEKSVDIYGDFAKTGNKSLDVLITQKALICTNLNITFTYIIDGNAFGFISVSDLTSLFGNIIDNAIEAANQEKGNLRVIKLSAYRKNGFISLIEENYSTQDIKFDESSLPITSKSDKEYHGFGTKSISFLVKKYNGTYSFNKEGNRFRVSLLIPIPDKK